jgi:hypothetical protein
LIYRWRRGILWLRRKDCGSTYTWHHFHFEKLRRCTTGVCRQAHCGLYICCRCGYQRARRHWSGGTTGPKQVWVAGNDRGKDPR